MNQITRMTGEQLLVLRVLAGRRFRAAIGRELERRARACFTQGRSAAQTVGGIHAGCLNRTLLL